MFDSAGIVLTEWNETERSVAAAGKFWGGWNWSNRLGSGGFVRDASFFVIGFTTFGWQCSCLAFRIFRKILLLDYDAWQSFGLNLMRYKIQ